MGMWYRSPRTEPTHKCDPPSFVLRDVGDDILPGDRYQCDCGKVWEVTEKKDAYAYGSESGAWYFYYRMVDSGLDGQTSIWWGYVCPRMANINILKEAQSELIELGVDYKDAGKILSKVQKFYVDSAFEGIREYEKKELG